MLNRECYSVFTQYFTCRSCLDDFDGKDFEREIKKRLRITLLNRRELFSSVLKNLYALRIRAVRGVIADVRLGIKINQSESERSKLIYEHDYVYVRDYEDLIKVIVPVFSGISFQVDEYGHSIITMYGFSKDMPTTSYTNMLCNEIVQWNFKVNISNISGLISELAPNLKTFDFTTSDNTSYFRVADILMNTEALDLDRVTIRLEEGCKPSIMNIFSIHRVKHLELWPCPWKLFLLDKLDLRQELIVQSFTVDFFTRPGIEVRFDQVERHLTKLFDKSMTMISTKNIRLAIEIAAFANINNMIWDFDRFIQRFMSPDVKYTLEINRTCEYGHYEIVETALAESSLIDFSTNCVPPVSSSFKIVGSSTLVAQQTSILYSDVNLIINWNRRSGAMVDREHKTIKLGGNNGL